MCPTPNGLTQPNRPTADLDGWADLAGRVSSSSMRAYALRSQYADDEPLTIELDALIGELDDAFSAAMRTVDRPPAHKPGTGGDGTTARRSAEVEEFASTMAHELSTPLAVIKIAADTLLRLNGDGNAPERHRLLEVIQRHSEMAVTMVRRLALSGEIAAGQVTLSLSEVDLAELVTESVEDLRTGVLGGHPVQVTVSQHPVIDADTSAVLEILFNLLANAAKYSASDAPIALTIDARYGVARVVVRDHGPGVTADQTDLIFEQHLQLDESSRGSGLGLYISRGLARTQGGDLAVRPAATGGSEFVLTLPLRVKAGPVADDTDRPPGVCHGGTHHTDIE
jgi:signal transduction histidine kinase